MSVTISGTNGIDKVQDGVVTSTSIADGAVTPTDLSTGKPNWDSSGNFQFNSGYGSVATAYACRAWVNFNGQGTVAIRASGNVSSITDRGTGLYTVNFTNNFPDINYVFTGYCNEGDSFSGDIVAIDGGRAGRSVSACPIRLWEISNSGAYDSFEYMCQFVR